MTITRRRNLITGALAALVAACTRRTERGATSTSSTFVVEQA